VPSSVFSSKAELQRRQKHDGRREKNGGRLASPGLARQAGKAEAGAGFGYI